MQVGDPDGHGRYGHVDEEADGLLCHECGGHYRSLGVHAYTAHGMTADEYRAAHGIGLADFLAFFLNGGERCAHVAERACRFRVQPCLCIWVAIEELFGALLALLGLALGFNLAGLGLLSVVLLTPGLLVLRVQAGFTVTHFTQMRRAKLVQHKAGLRQVVGYRAVHIHGIVSMGVAHPPSVLPLVVPEY